MVWPMTVQDVFQTISEHDDVPDPAALLSVTAGTIVAVVREHTVRMSQTFQGMLMIQGVIHGV
jgi:hypothetical protein